MKNTIKTLAIWLIIGLIFILLTLFLLRKKKFDEVYYRVNDKEYVKPKESLASYVLIGVGSGMILSFAVSSANVMFQLKDYSKDLYDKLPISWDYQYQYGLIYNNGYLDYDNMNDTSKMMIAFSNIDKIVEVEEKEIDKDIITYISKEDIIDSFKDIFNKAKNKCSTPTNSSPLFLAFSSANAKILAVALS